MLTLDAIHGMAERRPAARWIEAPTPKRPGRGGRIAVWIVAAALVALGWIAAS